MKTICLLGSPRREGNSDTLAQHFLLKASAFGGSIETIALSELQFQGCINLFACKQHLTHCGQEDDLTPVLNSIENTDVLVLASPIYFTNVTGLLKLTIDRFFSFFVPDYPTADIKTRLSPNKHVVLLQTQGEPEDKYTDVLEQYKASFTGLGFNHRHLVRVCGVRNPSDIKDNDDYPNQCDAVVNAIYNPRI